MTESKTARSENLFIPKPTFSTIPKLQLTVMLRESLAFTDAEEDIYVDDMRLYHVSRNKEGVNGNRVFQRRRFL